jgi:hypothetical protein
MKQSYMAWPAYWVECRRLDDVYESTVAAVRGAPHTERMVARGAADDAWRAGYAAARLTLSAATATIRGVA